MPKYEIVRVTNIGKSYSVYSIRRPFLFFWYKYLILFSVGEDKLQWVFSWADAYGRYCLSSDKEDIFHTFDLIVRRGGDKRRPKFEVLTEIEKIVGEK